MGATTCCTEDKANKVDSHDLWDNGYRPCPHSVASLELRVRCSDGQHVRLEANQQWTIHELMIAVMLRTGIHRACQRLTFAGRRLEPLASSRLHELKEVVDGSTFFVTILRDRFPERLGPYAVTTVPLRSQDFCIESRVDPSESSRQSAVAWRLTDEVLAHAGVPPRHSSQLIGRFSPAHEITLPEEERAEAQVPPQAHSFGWAYGVSGWEALRPGNDRTPLESFLREGGFTYFDKKHRVLRATSLVPSKVEGGGLQFSRPRPWDSRWTAVLMKQGRFFEVSSRVLADTGAAYYCWLAPGEVLLGGDGQPLESQPSVPHGGFAFIFHGADRTAAGFQEHGSNSGSPAQRRRSRSRSPAPLLIRKDVDVRMDRYFASMGEYRRRPSLKKAEAGLFPMALWRGRSPSKTLSKYPSTDSKQPMPTILLEHECAHGPSSRKVHRLTTDLAVTPEVFPSHWKAGCSGLVEVTNSALKAEFKALLVHANKQSNNWTRDRGCCLHGVNGCNVQCAYAHQVRVPCGFEILHVWRNQNIELWTKYCAMRAAIGEECDNGGSPTDRRPVQSSSSVFDGFAGSELQAKHNEWRLFHGAPKDALEQICRDNFNLRLAGMGGTWKEEGDTWGVPLYGFGVYFAEYITKADEYAVAEHDDPGAYSVLLCRVIGGRTKVVTDLAIDPNSLESQVLDGPFHSVFGDRVSLHNKPYREVMVYDKNQIFPEFLLTYRRLYARPG
mmetsp:Transcript_83077/g.164793  ORF Transcript_83077/g.164793 Transcript_83077/m.164793 type:complete len:726 (+) Transcript_83077:92-2269(+)